MCPSGYVPRLLAIWSLLSIIVLTASVIQVVRPYFHVDTMTVTECNTVTVRHGLGALIYRCGRACVQTCYVNCTFVQVSYRSPVNGSSRIGKLSYGEHDLHGEVKPDYLVMNSFISKFIWLALFFTNRIEKMYYKNSRKRLIRSHSEWIRPIVWLYECHVISSIFKYQPLSKKKANHVSLLVSRDQFNIQISTSCEEEGQSCGMEFGDHISHSTHNSACHQKEQTFWLLLSVMWTCH